MAFKQINEVIKQVTKELGFTDELFVVMKAWGGACGGAQAQVTGFKNGTVFVEAESSIDANEILLSRRQIIAKLNQYVGAGKIKTIKITIK